MNILELAKDCDREAVNARARQVHAMHAAWRPDVFEMVEELYPSDRFEKAVAEKQLYVARLDGETVGYGLVLVRHYNWPGVVDRKVLMLDELCVDENHRHQGIGKQMMEDIKDLARELGCTDIQLGVYAQNKDAIAFYERAGMTVSSFAYHMKAQQNTGSVPYGRTTCENS